MNPIKKYLTKRAIRKEINNNQETTKDTVKGNKSSLLSVTSSVMIVGAISYTLSPQSVNEMASFEKEAKNYIEANKPKRFETEIKNYINSLDINQEEKEFIKVKQEMFWSKEEIKSGGFLNDARKRNIVENLTDKQRKHFGFPLSDNNIIEVKPMYKDSGIKIKKSSKPVRSLSF